MDIIEKKTHNDKIQNFLDKGIGRFTITTIGGKEYDVTSYDIIKAYIEEQELKNDYLEKKILKLEKELKDFRQIYEINKRFGIN